MSGIWFGSALTRRPTRPSIRVDSRCLATCARTATPIETNMTRPTRAIANRKPCTRPALPIIFRCGWVHFFLSVSKRMFKCSHHDGSKRFSGLEFQVIEVSNSLSSARPRRVSFCLRVSQSRSE